MPPPRLRVPAAGHAAALTVILATMACAWLPVGGRADIPGGGGSIRRGGDKAEGAPAEERDAESAAKCAAEAAQFAAKAGLRRALLAYDADVEGRRMVYRAEPACAWAVADALAGLDEGTLARVVDAYAVQPSSGTVELAVAAQCVPADTCASMVDGVYTVDQKPAIAGRVPPPPPPRDRSALFPRIAVPHSERTSEFSAAIKAITVSKDATNGCGASTLGDATVQAISVRAAAAMTAANLTQIVSTDGNAQFLPPRLASNLFRKGGIGQGWADCGCCIFATQAPAAAASAPAPEEDIWDDALFEWAPRFQTQNATTEQQPRTPTPTPNAASIAGDAAAGAVPRSAQSNNKNEQPTPDQDAPDLPQKGDPRSVGEQRGTTAPDVIEDGDYDYSSYEVIDVPPTQFSSGASLTGLGDNNNDFEDFDYDYEAPLLPDLCPSELLMGEGEQIFDYKYGRCHWRASDDSSSKSGLKHVGQNGRTVQVLSCEEDLANDVAPGKQPANGERLISVLFRDGDGTEEDLVFYPNKFGRLVWFKDGSDALWACEIAFGADTLSQARTMNANRLDASNPSISGCDTFPWTHLGLESHPKVKSMLQSTEKSTCNGNENAGRR